MKEKIPDDEIRRNIRNKLLKHKDKELKITIFTHDFRKLRSIEGKLLNIGEEEFSIVATRDNVYEPPIKEGEVLTKNIVDVHTIVADNKVISFYRTKKSLLR